MLKFFKKNKYSIVANLFIFLILAIPFVVGAQGNAGSLVACQTAEDCNFRAFLATFNNIIRFTIQLGVAFFAIILAYAGWEYITAGGNASKISSAHAKLWTAVKGFVVLLLAYLIVRLIYETLGSTVSPF